MSTAEDVANNDDAGQLLLAWLYQKLDLNSRQMFATARNICVVVSSLLALTYSNFKFDTHFLLKNFQGKGMQALP